MSNLFFSHWIQTRRVAVGLGLTGLTGCAARFVSLSQHLNPGLPRYLALDELLIRWYIVFMLNDKLANLHIERLEGDIKLTQKPERVLVCASFCTAAYALQTI